MKRANFSSLRCKFHLKDLKGVIKNIIQEMSALPLKEEVKEKWLYQNAARLFHRDQSNVLRGSR